MLCFGGAGSQVQIDQVCILEQNTVLVTRRKEGKPGRRRTIRLWLEGPGER